MHNGEMLLDSKLDFEALVFLKNVSAARWFPWQDLLSGCETGLILLITSGGK